MAFLFFILTAVHAENCSKEELRSAICWALCRRDGYATGAYLAKQQAYQCANIEKFADITREVIRVPSVPIEFKAGSPNSD